MKIHADLHYHSGHAGGVGNVSLDDLAGCMSRKGINILGTGDCLHPAQLALLKKSLVEAESGFFRLASGKNKARREASTQALQRFVLQTEIIVTAAVPRSTGRKSVHIVVLLPSFAAIDGVVKYFTSLGMKNNIGRPFIKCEDASDVAKKLAAALEIDPLIELIPAHAMTPDGVFGSDNPIDHLEDFFGFLTAKISAVETGLSADPEVLALIPELDKLAFISSSDSHSAALNRLGREFTTLEVKELSYKGLISAIRANKVVRTAEFSPAEGRYFLTGHRAGREGHGDAFVVYSPDRTPKNRLCPICGKRLTVGVLERAIELGRIQGDERKLGDRRGRDFFHAVPLVEVIAAARGIRSASSQKVVEDYLKIIGVLGTEIAFWEAPLDDALGAVAGVVSGEVIEAIRAVRTDNFTFEPFGFDGTYGKLVIGKKRGWFKIKTEEGIKERQQGLFE